MTTKFKSLFIVPLLFLSSTFSFTPTLSVAGETIENADADFATLYKNFQQAQQLGETQRALAIYEKAYPLGIAKYGKESENAANLAFNYANLLSENGNIDQAEEYLKLTEERYKALFGDDSSQYFDVLLAQVKLFQNTQTRVEKRYERHNKAVSALLYAVDDIAEANPELATNLYYHTSIAIGKAEKLSRAKAIGIVKKALELAQSQWGEEAQGSIELNFILGALYQDAGKKRNAVEAFTRIVDIFNTHFDTDHPWEVAAHSRLVPLFEKLGESDKATEHCIAIGKMTPWQENIKPTPLYRVNPDYPSVYVRNKKEGAVQLSFTITKSGAVKDIKVDNNIKGGDLFVEESIKALKQWRYAPKVVNGETVEAKGQRVQLDFALARG